MCRSILVVTQSSSDGVAINYILSVLWMMSSLAIVGCRGMQGLSITKYSTPSGHCSCLSVQTNWHFRPLAQHDTSQYYIVETVEALQQTKTGTRLNHTVVLHTIMSRLRRCSSANSSADFTSVSRNCSSSKCTLTSHKHTAIINYCSYCWLCVTTKNTWGCIH